MRAYLRARVIVSVNSCVFGASVLVHVFARVNTCVFARVFACGRECLRISALICVRA